jgi:TRAP-type uncharacterized transport system fused permease subunit
LFNVLDAAVTAFFGVWIATAGVLGYFLRPMNLPMRAVYLVVGFALMIPHQAFAGAIYVEAAGSLVAVAAIASDDFAARQIKGRLRQS